jgi:hypothetical protein
MVLKNYFPTSEKTKFPTTQFNYLARYRVITCCVFGEPYQRRACAAVVKL